VRELALLLGYCVYHTHDSRRSDAGWPDLVLAHRARKQLLFVELKSARGSLRSAQSVWLDVLASCGAQVAVWRPAQWADGTIQRCLKGGTGSGEEPRA